jgi:protein-disulfide isomerase
MENENKTEEQTQDKKENAQQKITTPVAIVIAGVLIMVGILLTKGTGGGVTKEKTLSEQVGVSKTQLAECVKNTDKTTLSKEIEASVASAMKAVPADQRGTPYGVIIGSNGVKTEIRGADSADNVKKLIAEVLSGKVTSPYTGELPPVNIDSDHILGDTAKAQVTIIEYSDFECPYCKNFQATLKQVVTESNGSVAWVYRHWPIHQNSFEKLVASECVAKIKGNDAFWKYSDLLFGLLKTAADPITDQL